jgi:beta-N-acetylhexosaminidase
MSKRVILGINSYSLTIEEKELIAKHQPLGFILFARNFQDKEQLKRLTNELQNIVNHDFVPILIDQEGGRVQRLKGHGYWLAPNAKYFADMAQSDFTKAWRAVFLNYYLIGCDLKQSGINVNCAPVADLLCDGADAIIGDRSFGDSVEMVVALCNAACEGLLCAGVLPIIKHIPGHGRATSDSHLELPVINDDMASLINSDFEIFRCLKNWPMAMTAHIKYTCLDDANPVSCSKTAINFIRNELEYKNIIISDDIAMKALSGSYADKTKKVLKSGCDIVLHCTGDINEMQEILANTSKVTNKQEAQLVTMQELCLKKYNELDYNACRKELQSMLMSIV